MACAKRQILDGIIDILNKNTYTETSEQAKGPEKGPLCLFTFSLPREGCHTQPSGINRAGAFLTKRRPAGEPPPGSQGVNAAHRVNCETSMSCIQSLGEKERFRHPKRSFSVCAGLAPGSGLRYTGTRAKRPHPKEKEGGGLAPGGKTARGPRKTPWNITEPSARPAQTKRCCAGCSARE